MFEAYKITVCFPLAFFMPNHFRITGEAFVLSFFPLDVLDGIWDLIQSVSEGFLTYSLL